jgi:hypothetical protein
MCAPGSGLNSSVPTVRMNYPCLTTNGCRDFLDALLSLLWCSELNSSNVEIVVGAHLYGSASSSLLLGIVTLTVPAIVNRGLTARAPLRSVRVDFSSGLLLCWRENEGNSWLKFFNERVP